MTRTAAVKAAAAQRRKANNLTLPMNSQTLNFSSETDPHSKRGGARGEAKTPGPQSKALINLNIRTGDIASNNTITITRPGRT